MTVRRKWRGGWILGLSLAIAGGATLVGFPRTPLVRADEEIAITADLSSSVIQEGDAAELVISVSNAKSRNRPKVPPVPDCEVQYLGSRDRSVRSAVIINGQLSSYQRSTVEYIYRVQPKKAGKYRIPSPYVEEEGKEYRAGYLELLVEPLEQQDLVQLEIVSDRESVYPMQSFTVTLRVYLKALPPPHEDRDPMVAIPRRRRLIIPWATDTALPDGVKATTSLEEWLEPMQRNDWRGFGINDLGRRPAFLMFDDGGTTFRLPGRLVDRKNPEGRTQKYWEYSLSRVFKASRPGATAFGPVSLKGEFVASVDENKATLRQIHAVGKRLDVQVKEIPTEGRPDSFIGACGSFDLAASLSPRKARVGDPLTFTLTLKGGGLLEGTRPPNLESVPGLEGDFRVYEGNAESGPNERRFIYTVRPLRAGRLRFPQVPVSYFDVEREKYVTLESETLPLEVLPADQVAASPAPVPAPDSVPEAASSTSEPWFGPVPRRSEWPSFPLSPAELLVALGSLGTANLALVFLWPRWRRRREGGMTPRERAARCREDLDRAWRLRLESPLESAAAIRSAISLALGSDAGVAEQSLTERDVEELARRGRIEAATAEQVVRLFEACNAVRFGSGSALAPESLEEAATLVPQLLNVAQQRKGVAS